LNIKKYNILGIKNENIILWRVFIRPAAVLFPLLSYVISHDALILLIGIVLLISVIFDVLRLYVSKFASFFEKHFSKVYKKAEKKKVSSITGFLLGFFLTFFLFSREIAVTAVFFSIFGDMVAKFSGILFAKKKYYNKSLEGAAGFFTSAFICVYFLSYLGVIDFFPALIGASIATVVELLPLNIDDNISVPVISAFVMSLLI
jgi:glycerol-3-phosphate acyltransferase PlsY